MGQLRIGICDDEEMILKTLYGLVKQAVRKMGLEFEILVFSSGKDLLQQAEELEIAFLDIEMPELDGIEIGRMLRQRNSECEIIMATGIEERYKEAFHVRALRFVTKPFEPSEIEEAMDACLRRRSGCVQKQKFLPGAPERHCICDFLWQLCGTVGEREAVSQRGFYGRDGKDTGDSTVFPCRSEVSGEFGACR